MKNYGVHMSSTQKF